MMIQFDQLIHCYHWRPIRGCPGRYVLTESRPLSVQDLVEDAPIHRFDISAARDPVLVVHLEGGGLISYERNDGTLCHTLGDETGFRRKLDQLGIKPTA